MRKGGRWRACCVLSVGIGLGCASPTRTAPVLSIHNRSELWIRSIYVKSCDLGDEALAPIPDSEIRPFQALQVELTDECVDLVAEDASGRVAAEQRTLRPLHGTTWMIR